MHRSLLILASLLCAGFGCDSKEDPAASLPVASSWGESGTTSNAGSAGGKPHAGMNMGGADPHAGVDMGGNDPHAGVDMGGADPHAGVNMGGADPHAGVDMGGADPHAGVDMGGNELGGLQPPDPNRSVDPSQFLKGSLIASAATSKLIAPGAVIFLSVRPVNKATGESLGSPLAVERVELQSFPIAFHLSGEQSMVAGTAFEGEVMVYARVDGDGEASTTMPGDIEGSVMATIPADGLKIVLGDVVGSR